MRRAIEVNAPSTKIDNRRAIGSERPGCSAKHSRQMNRFDSEEVALFLPLRCA